MMTLVEQFQTSLYKFQKSIVKLSEPKSYEYIDFSYFSHFRPSWNILCVYFVPKFFILEWLIPKIMSVFKSCIFYYLLLSYQQIDKIFALKFINNFFGLEFIRQSNNCNMWNFPLVIDSKIFLRKFLIKFLLQIYLFQIFLLFIVSDLDHDLFVNLWA